MKKALILILIALILTGVALAAGGTAGDPLISLRYITDVFAPGIELQFDSAAVDFGEELVTEASVYLNGELQSRLADLGSDRNAVSMEIWSIAAGEGIRAETGSSLWLFSGRAAVHFASGAVIDATAGKTVASGEALKTGHRYLVGEDTSCTVKTDTDAAVGVEGHFSLTGGGCSGDEHCPTAAFTDLPVTAWYHNAIDALVEKGLMQGDGSDTFKPDGTFSRAMAAQTLYNLAGGSPVPFEQAFTDVNEGDWYANAVIWAYQKGYVQGRGDDRYEPDEPITRQEIMTLIWHYVGSPAASASLSDYADSGDVAADWALGGVKWALSLGGVHCETADRLLPEKDASRADVAYLLRAYLIKK